MRNNSLYATIFMCVMALGLSGCGDEDSDQAASKSTQTQIHTEANAETTEVMDHPALAGIQNTTWVLRRMNDRTVIDNVTVTMSLDSKGQIGGRSGCNNYGAGYDINGNQIKITEQMTATMMACVPPAIAEQEVQYLEILHKAATWQIVEPDTLVLTTSDHKTLLFTPQVPTTAP